MSPSNTFAARIRPLLGIGCIVGLLPCRLDLKFRWFSWQMLYAFALHAILLLFSSTCAFNFVRKVATSGNLSVTDSLSNGGYLALDIWTKVILTITCLIRSRYFVEFVHQMESYDTRFQHTSRLRIFWDFKLWIVYLGTMLGSVGSLRYMISTSDGDFQDASASSQCISNRWFGTSVVGFLPFAFYEAGLCIFIALTVMYTTAIRERIQAMAEDLNNSIGAVPHTQHFMSAQGLPKFIVTTSDGELSVDSHVQSISQYISSLGSLIKIRQTMDQALSFPLCVLVSFGILHVILFVYLALISIKQAAGVDAWEMVAQLQPLISSGLINISRLILLCECGHQLQNSVKELCDKVKACDPGSFASPMYDKLAYFQRLTVQVRFELTASGYYTLNRGFVSSLIGPVITFVVVLAQFRSSDFQPSREEQVVPTVSQKMGVPGSTKGIGL